MFINIVYLCGSDRPFGLLYIVPAVFLPISSLLAFFVCLFVLFHSSCSHARVFGKTLAHDFVTSYRHTDRYFILSLFGARETKHAQRTIS